MDGPFAPLQIAAGDELRCAFLQTSGDPRHEPQRLAQLLQDSSAAVAHTTPANWPLTLAQRMDETLRASMSDATAAAPTSAIFAAVALTRAAVHVCTAGDLRVYLVTDGRTGEVTRDHVYQNEPLQPPLPDLPSELAKSLLTRQLGGTPTRPPVAHVWTAVGACRLLICSSDFHHGRDPEAYGVEHIQADLAARSLGAGLIAVIDWNART